MMFHKPNFVGAYNSAIVRKPIRREDQTLTETGKKRRGRKPKPEVEIPLKRIYDGKLPIKAAKYKDLQQLKQFLVQPSSVQFYDNLKSSDNLQGSDDEYIDNVPLDEDDN